MVQGRLAGLLVPSVEAELRARDTTSHARENTTKHTPHPNDAIHLLSHTIPLPYPRGKSTLQITGLHLCLYRRGSVTVTAAKPPPPNDNISTDKLSIKAFQRSILTPLQPSSNGGTVTTTTTPTQSAGVPVKVTVIVKAHVVGPDDDRRRAPVHVLAVVPLSCDTAPKVTPTENTAKTITAATATISKAGKAAAVRSNGHAVWSHDTSSAFVKLDLRLQMEQVRLVVDILPAGRGRGEKRGRGHDTLSSAPSARALPSDHSVEVTVMGAITPLA